MMHCCRFNYTTVGEIKQFKEGVLLLVEYTHGAMLFFCKGPECVSLINLNQDKS